MSLLKYASDKLILSEDVVYTEFRRVEAGAADGGAASTAGASNTAAELSLVKPVASYNGLFCVRHIDFPSNKKINIFFYSPNFEKQFNFNS